MRMLPLLLTPLIQLAIAGLPAAPTSCAAQALQAPRAVPEAQTTQPAQPPTTIDRAFARLYNFDFRGAHRLLDEHTRADPADPLTYSVRAGAYLFEEFHRLRILEVDFFLDDENLIDNRRLKADPQTRRVLFEAVDMARARAATKLASDPNNRNALFALCMAAGVVMDYTGFVERRQWRGVRLAKETRRYAGQLLSLNPPMYDAHFTTGTLEYLVGSLPFFVRWFVRFDRIEGSKQKAIQELTLVGRQGRYYGPFARMILAVISLREGRLEDARRELVSLNAEFPENPIFAKELRRVTAKIEAASRGGSRRR